MAKLRGELKELPSSCGGSLAVSLTVRRSAKAAAWSPAHETEPLTCLALRGGAQACPSRNHHLPSRLSQAGGRGGVGGERGGAGSAAG